MELLKENSENKNRKVNSKPLLSNGKIGMWQQWIELRQPGIEEEDVC